MGVYNFLQDDSALEIFYDQTSKLKNRYAPRVDLDWWNGMTSVEGYGAIRQWNSVFYKDWRFGTAPGAALKWENAMRWDVSQTAALLSKRFDNWDYAESRYYSSPFSWINAGPLSGTWDNARPVSYVQTQLTAMRKFGMGRGFANYHHGGGARPSTYSNYAGALRAASAPGVVDAVEPTVTDASVKPGGVEGAAVDDLAVWSVRWTGLEWRFRSRSADILGRTWQLCEYRALADELVGSGDGAEHRRGLGRRHGRRHPRKRVDAGRASRLTPRPTRRARSNLTAKPPKRLKTVESRATVEFAFDRPAAPRDESAPETPLPAAECRIDRQRWHECDDGAVAYRLRAHDRWKRHRFRCGPQRRPNPLPCATSSA